MRYELLLLHGEKVPRLQNGRRTSNLCDYADFTYFYEAADKKDRTGFGNLHRVVVRCGADHRITADELLDFHIRAVGDDAAAFHDFSGWFKAVTAVGQLTCFRDVADPVHPALGHFL